MDYSLAIAVILAGFQFHALGDIVSSVSNPSTDGVSSAGPNLTGNWGGLRSQLEYEGVTPYVVYTSIISGNPSGGIRQAATKYAQDINLA
jgi:carbohydrate-selective porin OprB